MFMNSQKYITINIDKIKYNYITTMTQYVALTIIKRGLKKMQGIHLKQKNARLYFDDNTIVGNAMFKNIKFCKKFH